MSRLASPILTLAGLPTVHHDFTQTGISIFCLAGNHSTVAAKRLLKVPEESPLRKREKGTLNDRTLQFRAGLVFLNTQLNPSLRMILQGISLLV